MIGADSLGALTVFLNDPLINSLRKVRKKHTNPNCQCASCKSKRGETKGKNNSMFGKHPSEETKEKQRQKALGRVSPFTGHKHTKAAKKINAEKHKNPRTKASKIKQSRTNKGMKSHKLGCICNFCRALRGETKGKNHSMYGKKRIFTEEHKRKLKIARASTVTSDKTIRKILQSCKKSPNKQEQKLNKILQQLFLRAYKFVGDGKVIIGGFCPDFINVNGQKKIIELFGDYWHTLSGAKEKDKRRLKTYKKYGYETLIVWGSELKNMVELRKKLLKFKGAL